MKCTHVEIVYTRCTLLSTLVWLAPHNGHEQHTTPESTTFFFFLSLSPPSPTCCCWVCGGKCGPAIRVAMWGNENLYGLKRLKTAW